MTNRHTINSVNWPCEVSIVADTAKLLRLDSRARDRSERERRLGHVVRFRYLEANMTAAEIVTALGQLDPPIVASIRTVERDIGTIRESGRRYLTARNFDAPFEVSAALARYELIARRATQIALAGNGDGAKWARIAIRATEARTRLFQDLGMLDRQLGRLLIDDAQPVRRIPSGVELAEMLAGVIVTDADVTSEAELHYKYGDEAASLAAARDARDSGHDESGGN